MVRGASPPSDRPPGYPPVSTVLPLRPPVAQSYFSQHFGRRTLPACGVSLAVSLAVAAIGAVALVGRDPPTLVPVLHATPLFPVSQQTPAPPLSLAEAAAAPTDSAAAADAAACHALHRWSQMYDGLVFALTLLVCSHVARPTSTGADLRVGGLLGLLSAVWGWGLYGAALTVPAAPVLILGLGALLLSSATLFRDRRRSACSAGCLSTCVALVTGGTVAWALPPRAAGYSSCPAVWDDAMWLLLSFFLLLPLPGLLLLTCSLLSSIEHRNRGLDPVAVERLAPCCSVATEVDADRLRETHYGGGQCAVCFDRFDLGDRVRALPCRHVFHADCVDPWLLEQADCPTCRAPLTASSAPAASGSDSERVPLV
eukprot:TRINITY_DN28500_c0_g1_i1.p1 TRINITY_DN28500_c0_g1~~TRINITY_DN28500_c0_g1_i1.p1  ORF type:complete len:370 (+),score=86.03 TRINITY_DN28500_c0_g1_i1:53-1162(+)